MMTETNHPVQPAVAPKQRRTAPRRKPKGSTRVACRKGALGLGPNLARSILDLSEGGIRLVVKSPLKLGDEVEVSLGAPGGLGDVSRKGDVVWVVPAADGTWCIGVAFQKRLDYSCLQDLCRFLQS
jgi:PilZ domain